MGARVTPAFKQRETVRILELNPDATVKADAEEVAALVTSLPTGTWRVRRRCGKLWCDKGSAIPAFFGALLPEGGFGSTP